MHSVNNTPSTSFRHTGSVGETASAAAVSATQHTAPEGVTVTVASMPTISRQQSQNISNIRNNLATLTELQTSHRTMNPAQRSAIQIALEGAFAELTSLQESGASPLKVAAQKLYMQGLAQQHFPDLGSSSAYMFMSRFAPGLEPPLNTNAFVGTEIEKKTDRFTATNSLYKEVLASDLPDDKKDVIKVAYATFKNEVRRTENEAKQAVTNAEALVAATEVQLKTNTERPDSTPALVADSQQMHERAKEGLDQAKRDLDHLNKNGIGCIFLDETIASNEAAASPLRAKISALWGTTLPQALLSAAHFGGSKALIDKALVDKNMSTRVAGDGVVLGVTHKAFIDIFRPALVYAADKTGGTGVNPVSPDSVYPNPARVITSGGQVYRRSNEELQALVDENNEKKAAFKAAQADNKLGTLAGDVQGTLAYGLAHAAVRGVPGALGYMKAMVHPGFRTISSLAGAVGMVGWQSYKQLSQKVDGRHTHVPVQYGMTLSKTWNETKAGFKNALDLSNPAVRTEYFSRIASSAEAAIFAMNLNALLKKYDPSLEEDGMPVKLDLNDFDSSHLASRIAANVGGIVAEYVVMLQPFFGNIPAGAEANAGVAAGEYKDASIARFTNAVENIRNPDRPTVGHGTRPGTIGRMAENVHHFGRGITQLGPQATAVAMEAVVSTLVDKVGKPTAQKIADSVVALLSTPPAAPLAELTEIVIDDGSGQTSPHTQPPTGSSSVQSQQISPPKVESSQSSMGAAKAVQEYESDKTPLVGSSRIGSSRFGSTRFDSSRRSDMEGPFPDDERKSGGFSPLREETQGPSNR